MAFRELDTEHHTPVLPAHVLVEFGSLLRSLAVRRGLTSREAADIFAAVDALAGIPYWDDTIAGRAMELATRLGQSDTFDSTGYAIAERLGAEFWVSDRRFANAAATAMLPSIRFIA